MDTKQDCLMNSGFFPRGPITKSSLIYNTFDDVITSPLSGVSVNSTMLGKGGLGEVFTGTFQGQTVAVKYIVYPPNAWPEVVNEIFKREIWVLANMGSSPYIVKYLGVCPSSSAFRYSLVMEYVPGGTLKNLLASATPLSWPERYEIGIDIAKGLSHMHGINIIHGDIKNANILLAGARSKPVICDFSSAIIENQPTYGTETGETLTWMAPERYSSLPTKPADIFSFGLILWALASRKEPFGDLNCSVGQFIQFLRKGGRETIPLATPAPLEKIIRDCWIQTPEHRPSIATIVEELTIQPKKQVELEKKAQPEKKASDIEARYPRDHNAHFFAKGNPNNEAPEHRPSIATIFEELTIQSKKQVELEKKAQPEKKASDIEARYPRDHNAHFFAKGNPNNEALIGTVENHPIIEKFKTVYECENNLRDGILNIIEEGHATDLNRLFFKKKFVDQSRFESACRKNNLEKVSAWMTYPGINPGARESVMLGNAAGRGHLALVTILLTSERVNPADENNYALRVACRGGHAEVVQTLLSDARVNPCVYKNRPLQLAVERKHPNVIWLLLSDKRIWEQGLELLLSTIETAEQKGYLKDFCERFKGSLPEGLTSANKEEQPQTVVNLGMSS